MVAFMKKFISIVFFSLIIILNNTQVSAVDDVIIQTPEKPTTSAENEMIAVKQECLFAFYSTNDYADIVNNNLALVATSRVEDYKKVLERMTKLIDKSQKPNPKYCALFAESIITERLATLEAYIKYAECYSAGDNKGCNDYRSEIIYRSDRAAELYRAFLDRFKS